MLCVWRSAERADSEETAENQIESAYECGLLHESYELEEYEDQQVNDKDIVQRFEE